MSRPRVSIIIVHYGNPQNTKNCLESLNKLNYDNFEIIVVDNDPNNNFDFSKQNSRIRYIKNKKNLGFAGGNNIGIKHALKNNSDYVLLLNNDTIIDKGFLKILIDVGESESQVGILGPAIYKYNSNEIHFAGGKINWLHTKATHFQKIKNQKSKIKNKDTKHKILNTDYITGACMLIKRKVIEKIGLMPEEYFLYFEDVDWCLKARKTGFKCILVPLSQIWHKVSQSTKETSFDYIYYHTRNSLLLAKKNAPLPIKILAYLNSFFTHLKQLIKLIIRPNKKIWAKAIMLGIKDFYKNKFGQINKNKPC